MRRSPWNGPTVNAAGTSPNGTTLRPPPSIGGRWLGSTYQMRSLVDTGRSYDSEYHSPVMVREVLHYLDPNRGGLFLDGTLGGGGHSEALLRSDPGVLVVGTDRDTDALTEAAARLAEFSDRFHSVRSNFADAVGRAGIAGGSLSGALLDLGISSHQIDVDGRGFTFRAGAPLDMRMDGTAAEVATAADYLNEAAEGELTSLFYRWGEEKRSGRLARAIIGRRGVEPFSTSEQLVAVINEVIPRASVQDHARIFQALRIAVNEEIDSLRTALPEIRDALAPGGIMVVISYHSVEDRVVKDAFREWSRSCICPPGLPICICRGEPLGKTLTRKPVMASEDEIRSNPRSRSGRLRAWRKA